MKRKIIKQGHNTLTMTLPSEWVKKYCLKGGEYVDVLEKDNGLFLTAEKIDCDRKSSFDISEMDIPTIWKYFMAVYRQGYDYVEVNFNPDMKLENPFKFFTQHKFDLKYKKEIKKLSVLEFVHELVNRFIGYEIVDHGKDFVLIKELSSPSSKEFDTSLRRVFFLIQQMTEEVSEALKSKNPEMLRHIHDVDVNLDKFHDYCIRILNKLSHKDSKKSALYFSTLNFLELIGDEFKNIAHHLVHDFSHSEFKNVLEISESIREQIDTFYDLFYKFDLEKINKISDIDQKRYFDVIKFYKKATEDEKEIYHHLRIISRYTNALLELRIEMEF